MLDNISNQQNSLFSDGFALHFKSYIDKYNVYTTYIKIQSNSKRESTVEMNQFENESCADLKNVC